MKPIVSTNLNIEENLENMELRLLEGFWSLESAVQYQIEVIKQLEARMGLIQTQLSRINSQNS